MDLRRALNPGICLLLFASAAALAQPAKPAAPSNLQAIVISEHIIVLAWDDNSGNETEFRIEGRTAATPYAQMAVAPANIREALLQALAPATTYFFRVQAVADGTGSDYSNEVSATTPAAPGNCNENPKALCLGDGRFRVRALFTTGSGQPEDANVVRLTGDSGYLWFFDRDNVEVIVKIVNACSPPFQRFWFFAAGLTNVRVDIEVTDTETGEIKTYVNPLNQPFEPIQDTSGFDTCP